MLYYIKELESFFIELLSMTQNFSMVERYLLKFKEYINKEFDILPINIKIYALKFFWKFNKINREI